MKGKIKVLSLLCALAMVLAVFAGCADNSANTSNTGDTIDTTTEVELTWYHWGDQPNNPDAVIAALNEQSKKDINTTINFVWATGNDERLKSVMASGGDYDIAFTCSWFANYVTSAQAGYLADITGLLDKVPTLRDSMPSMVWDGARINGKIYAVPTYKDTAAVQYWLANKQVVEAADAMTEFEATGKVLSTVTPLLAKIKAYGKYENDLTAPLNWNKAGLNGYNTGWDQILDNIGIGARIGETTIKSYWEDADFITDMKTIRSWYEAGYINSNALTTENEFQYICINSAQGWEGAEITAWGRGAGKPYDCIINKKEGPYLTTNYIIGSCNGIKATSKNVERALLYLEYANTDANYRNMLAYGIEGTTYTDNGDGTITYINDDWKPGLFSQASFMPLKPVSPASPDMYMTIKAANESATPSDLVGFSLDTTNVQTQISSCEAIYTAYKQALCCGTEADVDATVSKMLTELRAAGYDEIIAEANKQVTAFLAAK